MPEMSWSKGRAQGVVAPRVFGTLGLGFDRSPLEVTRAEMRAKGPFLRALAGGVKTLPVGAGIRLDLPNQPAIEVVVIEHFDLPEGDYYILDWRSSRQPHAVEL